jgi:hypothetical protein
MVTGDKFTGDKVTGDKVYGDKITNIQEAPKTKPTLPPHTPHNLPERTTSAERFVGRSQELEQLKSLLAPEGSRAYLTGMGGVGKSELAIQHAYGSFDLYRGGILRLDARQGLDAMALQVVTFCRGVFPDLALPEDKSPTELLPLCWSQWPASANPPEPALLILDDQRGDKGGYEAERKLLEGLPPRFRRLITQRETAPTNAQAMELPLLEREASLELLALQAGEGGTARLKAEEQAADGLCSEVGDLPLALVLLGARLAERPDLRLEQLLADLQAKGAAAKALQQAHPELGAKLGVVEALLISWEPLTDPAKSLLLLLSVMAPAVIPWELAGGSLPPAGARGGGGQRLWRSASRAITGPVPGTFWAGAVSAASPGVAVPQAAEPGAAGTGGPMAEATGSGGGGSLSGADSPDAHAGEGAGVGGICHPHPAGSGATG